MPVQDLFGTALGITEQEKINVSQYGWANSDMKQVQTIVEYLNTAETLLDQLNTKMSTLDGYTDLYTQIKDMYTRFSSLYTEVVDEYNKIGEMYQTLLNVEGNINTSADGMLLVVEEIQNWHTQVESIYTSAQLLQQEIQDAHTAIDAINVDLKVKHAEVVSKAATVATQTAQATQAATTATTAVQGIDAKVTSATNSANAAAASATAAAQSLAGLNTQVADARAARDAAVVAKDAALAAQTASETASTAATASKTAAATSATNAAASATTASNAQAAVAANATKAQTAATAAAASEATATTKAGEATTSATASAASAKTASDAVASIGNSVTQAAASATAAAASKTAAATSAQEAKDAAASIGNAASIGAAVSSISADHDVTWNANQILKNGKILRALDNAGDIRNLIYMNNNNIINIGDPQNISVLLSNGVPRWRDGTTNYNLLTAKDPVQLNTVNPSVSATGTNQATATAITASINGVRASGAGQGVRLPAGVVGKTYWVFNTDVTTFTVYPPSGDKFLNHAVNQGITLAENKGFRAAFLDTGVWGYQTDDINHIDGDFTIDGTTTTNGDLVVNGNIDYNQDEINLGSNAGKGQGQRAIAIGRDAAATGQGASSIAIGFTAGQTSQAQGSVAIGASAGFSSQAANSVAVGINSGSTGQGTNSVAIGNAAGNSNQGVESVAIGYNAGKTAQGPDAVAVGQGAGATNQKAGTVAIGAGAGNGTQGQNGIAIGLTAGKTSQGANAIAIGNAAGFTTQPANSIAIGLNSTPTEVGEINFKTTVHSLRISTAGGLEVDGKAVGKGTYPTDWVQTVAASAANDTHTCTVNMRWVAANLLEYVVAGAFGSSTASGTLQTPFKPATIPTHPEEPSKRWMTLVDSSFAQLNRDFHIVQVGVSADQKLSLSRLAPATGGVIAGRFGASGILTIQEYQ